MIKKIFLFFCGAVILIAFRPGLVKAYCVPPEECEDEDPSAPDLPDPDPSLAEWEDNDGDENNTTWGSGAVTCYVSTEYNGTCLETLNAVCEDTDSVYYNPLDPVCEEEFGGGAFYKTQPSTSTNLAGLETNFEDDQLTWWKYTSDLYTHNPVTNPKAEIGFLQTLSAFPLVNRFPRDSCAGTHRSFSYINIPVSGWYEFGVGVNNSTTRNPSSLHCWYCLSPIGTETSASCWSNGRAEYEEARLCYNEDGRLVDCRCTTSGPTLQHPFVVAPSYAYPYGSFISSTDPTATVNACRPNCGGWATLHFAKEGLGTLADPYSPEVLSNPGSISLEADFERYQSWDINDPDAHYNMWGINVDRNKVFNDTFYYKGVKYFEAGWYPTQFVLSQNMYNIVYNPKVYWRVCTGSSESTCGPQMEYVRNTSNNGLLADISACASGDTQIDCAYSLTDGSDRILDLGEESQTLTFVRDTDHGSLSSVTFETGDPSRINIRYTDTSGISYTTSVSDRMLTINNPADSIVLTVIGSGLTTSPVQITSSGEGIGENCDASPISYSVVPLITYPWFQVESIDVTSLSDIISLVPSGNYFDNGLVSGIPLSGNINVSPGSVSLSGWNVETGNVDIPTYGFSYFNNLMQDNVDSEIVTSIERPDPDPSDFSAEVDSNGYEWYVYEGDSDLQIPSMNLASGRKIIILAGSQSGSTGPVNIQILGDVTLSDPGTSILMVVASGNITLDSSVSELDGVYIADGTFFTGTTGGSDDTALVVNGSVVGRSAVSLDRDLGTDNANTPAELFEYDPGMLLNIPYIFNQRTMKWKEVAP